MKRNGQKKKITERLHSTSGSSSVISMNICALISALYVRVKLNLPTSGKKYLELPVLSNCSIC